MELRVLEYYLMVAREENITRAAEFLHITQPTLSRQLAQLEEELGVRLFHRGKHNISLTEEGMLLKRRAQEILELSDKTKRELRIPEDHVSGIISVGSGETQNMGIFSTWMTEFQKKHPQVCFDIYSSTAEQIKERIERGLTDIGLLTEPVDVGKYQFIRLPEKERWGVLVSAEHPLAGAEHVTADELKDQPLLIPRRDSVKNEIANWFDGYFESLNVIATYDLIYNAAMLAKACGAAVLSMEHGMFCKSMKFIPLEPEIMTGAVLVWKKGQIMSTPVRYFTEYLKNNRIDKVGNE